MRMPTSWLFLDMELRAGPVAAHDNGRDRAAIIGGRDGFGRRSVDQRIAVHKVDMVIRLQAVQQRMRIRHEIKAVPAHLRQPQARRGHLGHVALDPAEAWRDPMFQARARPSVACPRRCPGTACRCGRRLDRLAHAGHGREARGTVREGALPRQHDPVSRSDHIRVRGHRTTVLNASPFGRQRQRAGRGRQVAAAVVNDCDLHAPRHDASGR